MHSRFKVELLGASHDRAGFTCGKPSLDDYIHKLAGQYARKKIASTWILTDQNNQKIIGFYTLSALSVDVRQFPEEIKHELPDRIALPVTLLGRLAIDQAFHKQNLGSFILIDALKRCYERGREIAAMAVVVDVLDIEAAGFYKKFGFMPLLDHPNRLYIPMATIKKLIEE